MITTSKFSHLADYGILTNPEHPDFPQYLTDALNESQLRALEIFTEYTREHVSPITTVKRLASIFKSGDLILNEVEIRSLFHNTFEHYQDISIYMALKRLTTGENCEFSRDECIEAIRWMTRDLTSSNEGKLTLPKSQDITDYRDADTVIPTTGTVVPTLSTLYYKIYRGKTGHTLPDMIFICVPNIPMKAILDQLQVKVTKQMLVRDYQKAMEWFKTVDPQVYGSGLLTYDDLDRFAEESCGLGSGRYKHFILQTKNECKITLNDIRELAGYRRDPAKDLYETRSIRITWEKEEVLEAYIKLWEGFGLDQDPPTVAEVGYYSKQQTILINEAGEVDIVAFGEANLPAFLVPNISSIEKHFGTFSSLLGHIDSDTKNGITVTVSSDKRLYELHKSALKYRELPMIKQIADKGDSLSWYNTNEFLPPLEIRTYIAPETTTSLPILGQ